MAATILEEFLVSVRFAKDAASEQNLLDTLKKIGGSVAGVTAAIVGLGVAIFKMTEHFANLNDEFYHTSQRLNSTISDIQATTFAMTAFGVSTAEATSAIEGLGAFSRSYGPIATNFMANLGITATSAEERFRQLGDFLRSKGFEPGKENTAGYMMGLRWARVLAPGASEQSLRAVADPRYGKELDEAHRVQRRAFGIEGDDEQAEERRKHALDAMGKQANEMAKLLSGFGFMFSAVMSMFSSNLFKAVQPQFERLFKTLEHWLPTINKAFALLANVVGIVMAGFNDFLDLLNWVAHILTPLTGQIDGLTVALFALAGAALTNPFVLMAAALVFLIGLMDDFRAYMQGGRHLFNWEGLFGGIKTFFVNIYNEINALDEKIDNFFRRWIGFSPFSPADIKRLLGESEVWVEGLKKQFTDALDRAQKYVEGLIDKARTWFAEMEKWGLGKLTDAWTKITDSWKYITDKFDQIKALFSGPDGLIKLMHDFIAEMNPLDWLQRAWGATADAIHKVAEILHLSGPSSTSGGATGVEGGTPGKITPLTGNANQLGMRDRIKAAMEKYGAFPISEDTADAMMSSVMGESSGDINAVSATGARGLFQLIPSRWGPASDWAKSQGLDPNSEAGQEAMTAHEIATNPQFLAALRAMEATNDPMEKRRIFAKVYEGGRPLGESGYGGIYTKDYEYSHSRWFPPGKPLTAPHPDSGATPPATKQDSLSLNNDVDIHVYASNDPAATARHIGDHFDRTVMNTARLARTRFA